MHFSLNKLAFEPKKSLSAILIFIAFSCLVACSDGQQPDIQRQQLPFGEHIFPVRFYGSNETEVLTTNNFLKVNLPKISAMSDRNTDDGSVISRHYSATLVESAWRNYIHEVTSSYLVETMASDAGGLSLIAMFYFTLMAANGLTGRKST